MYQPTNGPSQPQNTHPSALVDVNVDVFETIMMADETIEHLASLYHKYGLWDVPFVQFIHNPRLYLSSPSAVEQMYLEERIENGEFLPLLEGQALVQHLTDRQELANDIESVAGILGGPGDESDDEPEDGPDEGPEDDPNDDGVALPKAA